MRRPYFLLFLLLTACASQPAVMQYHQTAEQQIWPSPPDAPRYVFVGALHGESNFIKQTSDNRFKRALAWLAGVVFGESAPKRLQRPASGWIDETNGRIYVTDLGRHAVFVFDQPQGQLQVWDSATPNASFITPIGIAPGAANEILVADADLGAIVRLSATGEPQGLIGEQLLQRPTGLAVDASRGRLFVADSQAHVIQVFNFQGELLDSWGVKGDEPGELNGPTYLSFADDRLYVTDTLNSRVQIFDSQGRFLNTFGKRGLYLGNMPRPKGVATDRAGRIYVVESYYDYLLVYDAEGRLLLPIGGSGSEPGQFNLPAGVWTDSGKRIYVADMFNGRVVSFKYIGEDEITAAGNPQ